MYVFLEKDPSKFSDQNTFHTGISPIHHNSTVGISGIFRTQIHKLPFQFSPHSQKGLDRIVFDKNTVLLSL